MYAVALYHDLKHGKKYDIGYVIVKYILIHFDSTGNFENKPRFHELYHVL